HRRARDRLVDDDFVDLPADAALAGEGQHVGVEVVRDLEPGRRRELLAGDDEGVAVGEAHRGSPPSPVASPSVGAATRLLGGSWRGSMVSGTKYWKAISSPTRPASSSRSARLLSSPPSHTSRADGSRRSSDAAT